MVFKKFRETIAQTREHLKTAYDPDRLRAEMANMERAALLMPNLDPATALALPVVERVPAVEAAQAHAERSVELDRRAGPARFPIHVDRFTAPADDLGAVAGALAGLGLLEQPHRVWGVFPAPVLRDQGQGFSTPGPQEWVVVHAGVTRGLRKAPAAELRKAAPLDAAVLLRRNKWIERPKSEGIVFDEEVAALYATRSGIEPQHCLGIHRVCEWTTNFEAAQPWAAVVPVGVRVLSAPGAVPDGAMQRFASRPAPFAEADDPGARVDLVGAGMLAHAHRRGWTDPDPAVTDLPRLPADPVELLVSWLRLTGVDPADCYGVSISIREDQYAPFGKVASDRGDAGSLVAAVYRDRPGYAEGRDRFAGWLGDIGLVTTVERERVEGVLRAAQAASKLAVIGEIGTRAFRKLDISKGQDAQLWHYAGGHPPA